MTQPNPELFPIPENTQDLRPKPEELTIGSRPALMQEQFAYLITYSSGQKAASLIIGEALADQSVEIERLRTESLIDPLTGISNRRKMEQTFHGLVEEHPIRRHDETLPAFRATHTALMIDLDNFRDINNTEGHAAGDMVLKAGAERISNIIRDRDELGRIGGDELAVFLARTPVDKGQQIAEEIRAGLDSLRIGPKGLRITASIGVAELAHAPTLEEGLRRADIAAYASKEAGRNRVTVYNPSLPPKGE